MLGGPAMAWLKGDHVPALMYIRLASYRVLEASI